VGDRDGDLPHGCEVFRIWDERFCLRERHLHGGIEERL
jgi:hypothetical protein